MLLTLGGQHFLPEKSVSRKYLHVRLSLTIIPSKLFPNWECIRPVLGQGTGGRNRIDLSPFMLLPGLPHSGERLCTFSILDADKTHDVGEEQETIPRG